MIKKIFFLAVLFFNCLSSQALVPQFQALKNSELYKQAVQGDVQSMYRLGLIFLLWRWKTLCVFC